MKILGDFHTHTMASTHAYSTIGEMAQEASSKGLIAIGITNHGPSLPDSPHIWHFDNMYNIPDYICGVRVLKGIEANIINTKGEIDIYPTLQKRMELIVASFHPHSYQFTDKDTTTKTLLNLMDNPYIKILGHLEDKRFDFHYDEVIAKAKEKNILVEMNETTFTGYRQGGDILREIALCCKKHGASVVMDSDAHYHTLVGQFPHTIEMLKDIDMPYELIFNYDERAIKSIYGE